MCTWNWNYYCCLKTLFFQIVLCLNMLAINWNQAPQSLIQVEEVKLNLVFFLTSLWLILLPVVIPTGARSLHSPLVNHCGWYWREAPARFSLLCFHISSHGSCFLVYWEYFHQINQNFMIPCKSLLCFHLNTMDDSWMKAWKKRKIEVLWK